MRKNNNYELTDRITVTYNASDKVKNAIEEFSDYIKKETLATKLEFSENANDKNLTNVGFFLTKAINFAII